MREPAEIIRHHDPVPDGDPFVTSSQTPTTPIQIVPYDGSWPASAQQVVEQVQQVLGDRALELQHIGSTSVPGLDAKPVIDIDLVVADSSDEESYLPDLVSAGFIHVIREPWWHEHRCLVLERPRANLHVFSPNCPEVLRHRLFRDWLISHHDDRRRYVEAKRLAASASTAAGERMVDYNARKEQVIRDIYDDIFRANGWLS